MSPTQTELRLDQDELQELLLGPWAEDRRKMRKLMEDPLFHHQFNLTMEEHRELTLKQLQELADRKVIRKAYPRKFGGEDSPGGNIAGFGEMFHAHPSMRRKCSVQWGLFGPAMLRRGHKERHKRWRPGVVNHELTG